MPDDHFYEPKDGHRLPHDPMKAIIAPRPIGWISTRDARGRPNLAPYSYFNGVCDAPPAVMFASAGRKDSLRNAEATGEFVCNLVTRDLADAMNVTSLPLAPGVSEFDAAGLETADCRLVKAPRVAAATAALECKLLTVVRVPTLAGPPADSYVVIGQVVGVHLNPAFLRDGLFDLTAAGTVARCGYAADYAEVRTLFHMPRPMR